VCLVVVLVGDDFGAIGQRGGRAERVEVVLERVGLGDDLLRDEVAEGVVV